MRDAGTLLVALLVMVTTGCASMCDSSLDCDYHAFGGMRDRHDRVNGRVGSRFDPASAQPSIVPPLEALPPELDSDNDNGKSGDDGPKSVDGNVDDSGLTDELIEDLDKRFDDLPDVPKLEGRDAPTDAAGDVSET